MYWFEVYEERDNNTDKHILLVFLGQYTADDKQLVNEGIQQIFNKTFTPEEIYFLYPSFITNDIDDLFKDNSFQTNLNRQSRAEVTRLHFDEQGHFFDGHDKLDEKQILNILKFGLNKLMSKYSDEVLVRSPPGTVFTKPSGDTLEEFIYASQLTRSSEEVQFLAAALLHFAPNVSNIKEILIDTAALSAVVESIIYYITKFQDLSDKKISYKSFGSYSGIKENFKPDNSFSVWVIISASASTNMGSKIFNRWGLHSRQIVTILSYKDQNIDDSKGQRVLHCINSYSRRVGTNKSPLRVKMQGERFTAEISNALPVMVKKSHKPNYINNAIYSLYNSRAFKLNKIKLQGDTNNLPRVFFDFNAFKNSSRFKEFSDWIDKVITWTITYRIKYLIIGPSVQDNDFATIFQEKVRDHYSLNVEIVNLSDIKKLESIKEDPVVILSSCISTGNFFVDCNRALRLAGHDGMRTFITCYSTPPSAKHFDNFSKSLVMAPYGMKYNFLSYKTIYPGTKAYNSWEDERLFIEKLLLKITDSPTIKYWEERLERLNMTGSGLGGNIGLSYKGNDGELCLSPDFVFWPPGYNSSDIDYEAVFLTIACILQRLRESDIDGDTLRSNVYQHYLLSPENFIRYNDPIIQSCLWRAAKPYELDYRASEEVSNDFSRVLIRIISSCKGFKGTGQTLPDSGTICLDLLLGIALEWIKLTEQSLKEIVKSARECLEVDYVKPLIAYIEAEFIRQA